MKKRIYSIAKKEVKQLFRDRRMMFVVFFFPVFLLGIFGYAVNFDVHNIRLAVLDNERSQLSRDFIASVSSSSYFDIVNYLSDNREIDETLNRRKAQAVLVIPADFSSSIFRARENAKIQFIIDGVDGNTATIIKNYALAATANFNQKIQSEFLPRFGINFNQPAEMYPLFWFNPELQTTKFLLPGLIALILVVTSVVTVSLSLVREKEKGTIEQINVSSIKTIELLLGKSFPYLIMAFINTILILAAGYLLFDISVKGNYFYLFVSIAVFLFACTSVGIFISAISQSQQFAFTAATFFSLLPSLILSGFIFPIESMPAIIQVLTNITPTKFFIISLRAIMLRGASLDAFYIQWFYLILYSLISLLLASLAEKSNLKVM
jgi:ABC-2 type transport system permease protein